MRPLHVIICVLGALCALGFAVFSLTGNSARGTSRAENVVEPAVNAGPDDGPRVSTIQNANDVLPPARTLGETEGSGGRMVADPTAANWANSLSGRVTSPEGMPLEGVRVSLYIDTVGKHLANFHRMMKEGRQARPVKQITTGSDGVFAFRALKPSANYSIQAVHGEYAMSDVGPINVPETGKIREDIQLEVGYHIVGQVRERESGMPIEGVQLVLDDQLSMNMGNPDRPGPHRKEFQTDAKGKFIFPNLTAMTYSILAKKEGLGTVLRGSIGVLGENEQIVVEIEMEPGEVLAGRVVDGQGNGIVGAEITAMSHSPANRERGLSKGVATSGRDGEFFIEDVMPGTYTLMAKADGFQAETPTRIKSGETNIVLRMSKQGSVMGRVLDGDTGRPVPNFKVFIREVNPTSPQLALRGRIVGRTNVQGSSDGRFEVGGVSTGTYTIQANAQGYANSFSARFVVTEGSATPDVEVRLTRGGTIRGTVLDARTRKPVSGVVVSTHDNNWIDSDFTNMLMGMSESHVGHQKTTTKADGTFEISMLSAETYQVKFTSPDHTVVRQNDVRIEGSAERDMGTIMLSSGCTVKGHVFLGSGASAKGVSVYLQPSDGNLGASMTVRCGTDGSYAFRNASPGDYKLSASRPTKQGNPFQTIVDMRDSEKELSLYEGNTVTQDLHIQEQ